MDTRGSLIFLDVLLAVTTCSADVAVFFGLFVNTNETYRTFLAGRLVPSMATERGTIASNREAVTTKRLDAPVNARSARSFAACACVLTATVAA